MRFAKIILLLAAFTTLRSVAQQPDRSRYSLLWEITGNGLTKPSYLFGTIHVREKSVFSFCDSMLICMDRCDAFATEVHPDSILCKMFEGSISREIHTDGGPYLGEEGTEFTGDPGEVGQLTDGWGIENEKQNRVFLDMYLVDRAGQNGKTIIGLETYLESAAALQALKSGMYGGETMADIADLRDLYITGDIEALYRWLELNYAFSPEVFEAVFATRNKGMANQLGRQMRKQSVFAAVGAGHLGGPGGMVQLLRDMGYSMRPVTATFSPKPPKDSYDPGKPQIDWTTMILDGAGMQVNVPCEPVEILQLQGIFGMRAKISYDIRRNFMVMSMELPINMSTLAIGTSNEVDFMEKFAEGFLGQVGGEMISSRSWEEKGKKQGEFTAKTDGATDLLIKVRFMETDNAVSILVCYSVDDKLGRKLLNSAVKSLRPAVNLDQPLIPFSPPGLGISLSVTGPVQKNLSQQINGPNFTNKYQYFFSDPAHGITWNLKVWEEFSSAPVSTDTLSLMQYISGGSENLGLFMMGALSNPVLEKNDAGWSFHETSLMGPGKKGQLWIRGNSVYVLYAGGKKQLDSEAVHRIFDSVKFTEPAQSENTEFAAGAYSVLSPGERFQLVKPVRNWRSVEDEQSALAMELTTEECHVFRAFPFGPLTAAEHIVFPEYYGWKDQQQLVNDFLKMPLIYCDPCTAEAEFVETLEGGVEITFKAIAGDSSFHVRGRAILKNMEAIVVYAAGSESGLADKRVSQILRSLKPAEGFRPNGNFFEDKSVRLLSEIDTVQSVEMAEKLADAVDYYPWKTEHLPALMRLAEKEMPMRSYEDEYPETDEWVTDYRYNDLRRNLLIAVNITPGEGKMQFLKKVLPALIESESGYQESVFRIPFSLPPREALPQVIDVWKTHIRGKGRHLLFDRPDWFMFYDSLSATAPRIADIVEMALDTSFTYENRVLWMLVQGIRDGDYQPEALQPFRSQILSEITRWIAQKEIETNEEYNPDEHIGEEDYYEYEYDYEELYLEEARVVKLINLLGFLRPGPDADALISKLFELGEGGLYRPLMQVWIMHGKADRISEEYYYHLHKDEDRMIAFWKLLERTGKTGNYPPAMLDQDDFAEAWAFQFLEDNDSTGRYSVEEVSSRQTIFHGGDSVAVYVFKVQESGSSDLVDLMRNGFAESPGTAEERLEKINELIANLNQGKSRMMLVGPFKTGEGSVTTDCSLCRIGEDWGEYSDQERIEMMLSPAAGK